MNESKIFIGSSIEGLKIANTLKILLEKEFKVAIWYDIFKASDYTLESLLKEKDKCDFAVLIATPDDTGKYRGQKVKIPRDNIIFELGLFFGCIGKERTFIFQDRDKEIKLPTDILGITPLKFSINKTLSLLQRIFLKFSGNYSTIKEQDWKTILSEPTKELITLMKELRPIEKKVQTATVQAFVPQENQFTLIKSFPIDCQKITTKEIKNIYLKFNNPVDKSTVPYIGNLYVRDNSFCQWNICGWIQFEENDTKITWHVHEENLSNTKWYGTFEGYHTFEIHIGREPEEWRLKDINGKVLPRKVIKVYT